MKKLNQYDNLCVERLIICIVSCNWTGFITDHDFHQVMMLMRYYISGQTQYNDTFIFHIHASIFFLDHTKLIYAFNFGFNHLLQYRLCECIKLVNEPKMSTCYNITSANQSQGCFLHYLMKLLAIGN
jgi:hypothetical protein